MNQTFWWKSNLEIYFFTNFICFTLKKSKNDAKFHSDSSKNEDRSHKCIKIGQTNLPLLNIFKLLYLEILQFISLFQDCSVQWGPGYSAILIVFVFIMDRQWNRTIYITKVERTKRRSFQRSSSHGINSIGHFFI